MSTGSALIFFFYSLQYFSYKMIQVLDGFIVLYMSYILGKFSTFQVIRTFRVTLIIMESVTGSKV